MADPVNADAGTGGEVPPPIPPIAQRSSLPTTLGVCNIVAGTFLILGGLCCGVYGSIYLVMGGQMAGQAARDNGRRQAASQELAKLKGALDQHEREQSMSAEPAEEEETGTQPASPQPSEEQPAETVPVIIDSSEVRLTDDDDARISTQAETITQAIVSPAMQWFLGIEVFSGFVLNMLLLFSGIGLLSRRPWGLRWSLRACWLKIIRLVVLYSLLLAVLLPNWGRGITTAMAPLEPDPKTVANIGQGITIFGSSYAVSVLLLGLIYPGVMLWLLRKPEVAAECGGQKK